MVRLALHSIAYEAKTLNLSKEGYTAFYVDGTTGNDVHDGGSWGQAFKTIQHAVDEAGSWCKIFAKAGTYAENIVISDQGIHLIGERTSTVIIEPASGLAISSIGVNTSIETLTAIGTGTGVLAGIHAVGARSTVKDVCGGNNNTNGTGILIEGDHSTCDGITINQSNKPGIGIQIGCDYCTVKKCVLENVYHDAIKLIKGPTCKWNIVQDNTIINTGLRNINITGADCEYNSVFHNNLIKSLAGVNVQDDTGADNKFFENFYDDHTTDSNNDGLCDSPYSFTTGTDYQPVSRRNGWNQGCVGTAAGYVEDVTFRKLTKSITLNTGSVPQVESLFIVTGEIECYVIGYVDTTVTSAGALTLSSGVSGWVDGLIATTPKGNLLADRVWVDATASKVRPSPARHVIGDGSNIIHYIAAADATGGAITYYCWWRPLSSDGNVVAA